MIRDPECPRCYGVLDPETGLCRICEGSEIVRAVAAVRRMEKSEDLDERAKVLAELRLTEGRRHRCR